MNDAVKELVLTLRRWEKKFEHWGGKNGKSFFFNAILFNKFLNMNKKSYTCEPKMVWCAFNKLLNYIVTWYKYHPTYKHRYMWADCCVVKKAFFFFFCYTSTSPSFELCTSFCLPCGNPVGYVHILYYMLSATFRCL